MSRRPNLVVILIDDMRFDETGASGHPYMRTPHIDRLAHEGAQCVNAFHTTPLCSPNRASILTGQHASRHDIIDNVGRDAMSHRLANYHLALQGLGYETAHIGRVHKEGMDELYDLARDPYEITNVIGQPAYRETVVQLRGRLRSLVAEAVGL